MKNPRLAWKGVQFGAIGVTSLVLKAIDRDLGRRYLIKEFSRLPGLGHKMGQLLAMRFGVREWDEFKPEPVPIGWIKSQIEKNVPSLARDLSEIDPKAELASIGQVHRGLLKDGREVAIKVRYPQVDETIEEQLDVILLGFRNIPNLVSRTMDVGAYEVFFRRFFGEELDYLHEARLQTEFRETWQGLSSLTIPEALTAYSSKSVLVQIYEESTSLSQMWDWPEATRVRVADRLTEFFLGSLLKTGLVHTDLHPKNWGYNLGQDRLVLYDFGATLRLDPLIVGVFRDFAAGKYAGGNADVDRLLEAYQKLGFQAQALQELKPDLVALTDLFFAPFYREGAFDFKGWNIQGRAEKLLGSRKWLFRAAGAPWFLMVIRSLNGWLYAIHELRVRVDVSATVVKYGVVREVNVDSVLTVDKPRAESNQLRVRISEGGTDVVALEFPVFTVHHLEELMPEKTVLELREQGIDIDAIKERALASGLVAKVLFEASRGSRTYRVWIE